MPSLLSAMLLRLFNWFLFAAELARLVTRLAYTLAECAFRLLVPKQKKNVANSVVVVTGAARGLGREIARIFAELGAKVVLLDIDQARNNETAKSIRSDGGKGFSFTCDVTDEDQVKKVAQKIGRLIGEVDILVNNAGIAQSMPILNMNPNQIRRTMEVNTLSHFWTIQEFLPKMLERRKGHIVAVSSMAGLIGAANYTEYCASKFAIMGLMLSLERELAQSDEGRNIRLSTVCPAILSKGFECTGLPFLSTWFPSIFPSMDVQVAAQEVVTRILREEDVIILPASFSLMHRLSLLLPHKVGRLVQEYLDYMVNPSVVD
ncbi:short-chain dehydrogenase/reductase family 16C member 6 isoform X1 [Ixodes scapularis]|uniref:short-chain dehydrogenase/reductase family 16C member 6 isoform X1 n=2 Tax=Ixodes scapularis TaxID=6945 RepID=UPI001974370D|nr:short-chain dehydrogenase/reductase family 16C member 6 isoform X1 [Ixodes scapularis]